MAIPTYHDVIAEARRYYRGDEASPWQWQQAEQILRKGMEDFPYALPIGDELVLVLEKQHRDDEALALLEELKRIFKDAGEETLSRFGKIFKKRADRLATPLPNAAAIPALIESERYYALAFEKSGAFYARVNQLTTRFLQAAVQKQLGYDAQATELIRTVREEAEQMLKDPQVWQSRLSDDNVWLPATQGEVYLLLANWQQAADAYAVAIQAAVGRFFYHDCMQKQVEMVLGAHQTLGQTPNGPISNPALFFVCKTAEQG